MIGPTWTRLLTTEAMPGLLERRSQILPIVTVPRDCPSPPSFPLQSFFVTFMRLTLYLPCHLVTRSISFLALSAHL